MCLRSVGTGLGTGLVSLRPVCFLSPWLELLAGGSWFSAIQLLIFKMACPGVLAWQSPSGKRESRSSGSLEATFRGCAVSLHDILKGKARTKVSPDSMGWEIN